MEQRVRDRLRHIRLGIAAIENYISGQDERAFIGNPLLVDAVERNLERISEASRHVPESLKAAHPAIPWGDIAGIGNVLRHDYPRVNPLEIWWTIVRDLGPLKDAVAAMLRENDTDEGSGGD
jgi:uncharacterized protein with HEPN domain